MEEYVDTAKMKNYINKRLITECENKLRAFSTLIDKTVNINVDLNLKVLGLTF